MASESGRIENLKPDAISRQYRRTTAIYFARFYYTNPYTRAHHTTDATREPSSPGVVGGLSTLHLNANGIAAVVMEQILFKAVRVGEREIEKVDDGNSSQ
jgi:hypothetical protein